MSAPWRITNTPSSATAAAASVTAPTNAGTTGQVTRLRSLEAGVACGATAQTPLQLTVRDGNTSSGAIIVSLYLAAPANSADRVSLSDLDIRSSVGNGLTVQMEANNVTGSQSTVNAQGDFVAAGYPMFQN